MSVFSVLCRSLDTNMMCCHLTKEDAECISTIVENFASCENMLKNPAPRYSIWAIGVLSLLGSVCVLVLRHFLKEKNAVQVIMLMHLAVADGLMGVYLLTIAVVDRLWSGEYYLHDFQWRFGLSCQITGAISVLSSEVSAMLLTLISGDRFKKYRIPLPRKSPDPAKGTHFVYGGMGCWLYHSIPSHKWHPLFQRSPWPT